MQRLPRLYNTYLDYSAARLPLATPNSNKLIQAAMQVLKLQEVVHANAIEGIPHGRFDFLGHSVDFGSIDAVDWRYEIPGEEIPMWRLTLSYMGWSVCLLASGKKESLFIIEQAVKNIEQQNPLSLHAAYFDVWRPYSVSHRLINLLSALALYRAANGPPNLSAERTILNHVRRCAMYLLHNLERDLQYNHLLKNLVALSFYRAATKDHIPRFNFLEKEISRSIRQQHLDDGGHAERSPMYHSLYLLDLLVLGEIGFSVDKEIQQARVALGTMIHPDGDIALFNDAWLGEAPLPASLGASASNGKSLLPVTGYTRLGGAEDAVIFDCGACGPDSNPGHAHADFLSIEASICGDRFLVDPGVPTYSPGPLRDQSRSSANHNGPHFQDWEPLEFWQSFRVGHRGYAYSLEGSEFSGVAPLWCAGWHNGYKPKGAIVARWIGLWAGNAMLIIDEWYGSEPDRASLKLLIPTNWHYDGAGQFTSSRASVNLKVYTGSLLSIENGEYSSCYNRIKTAHAVILKPSVHEFGARSAMLFHWGGSINVKEEQIHRISRGLRMHCERTG